MLSEEQLALIILRVPPPGDTPSDVWALLNEIYRLRSRLSEWETMFAPILKAYKNDEDIYTLNDGEPVDAKEEGKQEGSENETR